MVTLVEYTLLVTVLLLPMFRQEGPDAGLYIIH